MAAKKASLEIIQATTAYHYHVLPSDLARATVSPERAAIWQYLSRLGSDRFVDFVIDLLVLVEGHTLVERTDGPGDEKQDVLTLDPRGERHLTQCKHTANYGENTNGDELDLLFGACFRKNCRTGLYVTNADLTVQATRYVTDREYARGSTVPHDTVPVIDYWNGRRIWDRVSRSNAILNKWFSGMAQAHALRRFLCDVVLTGMESGEPCPLDADAIATELKKTHKVVAVPGSRSFDVVVDDRLTINLSDWFRGSGELGTAFLPPGDDLGHPNLPLHTVRVQALVSEGTGAYDVTAYRDRIAEVISRALPVPPGEAWWHVLVTAPQAFVFLQDVTKAALVTLDEPAAFVRVGGVADREVDWAVRPGAGFTRVTNPDEPETGEWRHEGTATTLRVLVEQTASTLATFEMHLRQEHIFRELQTHAFRAVAGADPTIVEAVRRLCSPTWYVLRSSTGDLFWSYPPDAEEEAVRRLEESLVRRGVEVLAVRDEDREHILSGIDTAPAPLGMIVSDENALTTPVSLTNRTFWLSRDHEIDGKVARDRLLELLKFKVGYETRHGHDLLGGKPEGTFSGEELMRLLFDPMSYRGRRMIDVGFHKGRAWINLRVREGSIASAAELATGYVAEFERVCREVLGCLAGPGPSAATAGRQTV